MKSSFPFKQNKQTSLVRWFIIMRANIRHPNFAEYSENTHFLLQQYIIFYNL